MASIIPSTRTDDRCAICLEEFGLSDTPYTHVGGENHAGFHRPCLEEALTYKSTCPLDRIEIARIAIARIAIDPITPSRSLSQKITSALVTGCIAASGGIATKLIAGGSPTAAITAITAITLGIGTAKGKKALGIFIALARGIESAATINKEAHAEVSLATEKAFQAEQRALLMMANRVPNAEEATAHARKYSEQVAEKLGEALKLDALIVAKAVIGTAIGIAAVTSTGKIAQRIIGRSLTDRENENIGIGIALGGLVMSVLPVASAAIGLLSGFIAGGLSLYRP